MEPYSASVHLCSARASLVDQALPSSHDAPNFPCED